MNDIFTAHPFHLLNSLDKNHVHANLLLSRAIGHFADCTNLDVRCFFLTIGTYKREFVNQIGKVVYLKICRAIHGTTNNLPSHLKPALILSEDIDGSRVNKFGLHPTKFHFHGILILPYEILERVDGADSLIEIESAINSLREVSENTWIKKFDPSNESLNRTIGYASKSVLSDVIDHGVPFSSTLYPFDLELCNKKSPKAKLWMQNSEKIFGDLMTDHRPYFSHDSQKQLQPHQSAFVESCKLLDVYKREKFKSAFINHLLGHS